MKTIEAGTTIRMTRKWLKSTMAGNGHKKWAVVACGCGLCAGGRFVSASFASTCSNGRRRTSSFYCVCTSIFSIRATRSRNGRRLQPIN